MPKF
jgi:hypothetical protein